MIIQFLISIILGILNGTTSINIPYFLVKVSILPFGIDSILVQGMGYYYFLMTVFPPLTTILNAVLFVIVFKIGLKLLAIVPILRGILYKG